MERGRKVNESNRVGRAWALRGDVKDEDLITIQLNKVPKQWAVAHDADEYP